MNRTRMIAVAIALGSVVAAVWLGLRERSVEPAVFLAHGAAEEPHTSPPVPLALPRAAERASDAIHDAQTHAHGTEQDGPAPTPSREPPSHVLYGYLRPAKGRTALVDGAVVLYDQLGERQIAHCGADGAYSFSGLAPGGYSLSSRSPVNGSVRVDVDLDTSVAEKRVDLQLVLPPEVHVIVKDSNGKPLEMMPRLAAVATAERPGEWLDEFNGHPGETFGVGSFRWKDDGRGPPDAEIGTLMLDREPPVYASIVTYQHVVATQRIEPRQSNVEFVLERNSPALQKGSLRVRFVDAETHAVVEAEHMMLHGGAGWSVPREGDAFHVQNLPPGQYQIQAFARGYERLGRRVRVSPGVETDLGDVALERGLSISGTVVDPDGRGCEMQVSWNEYDRETGEMPNMGTTMVVRSHGDGEFKIVGLSRGLYIVRTISTDREHDPFVDWSKVIDTSAGSVESVRIELVRGVPLVLRASDPEHWKSVRFKILAAASGDARVRRLWSFDPQRILLAPGSYAIEVRADEHAEPKRIPVTIARDPVELAIP